MGKITPRQSMLTLIGIGIIFRMILSGSIGLGVDESYVVAIARTLSLSYFDHPPLHFWIIWLTTHLTHVESGLILRVPFVLLFAGTTWMMYRLASRLFGEWAGVYAALTLNISAVFGLSTGSWILPDGPLMFFMLATVLVLTRLLLSPIPAPTSLWLLAGILLGLSLLSKYHAIFIAVGSFVFLLTSKYRRNLLLTPGPYIAFVIALVVFLPVVIWNQEHNWISFLFQGGRGAVKGFYPGKMATNLAGQAVWILPWIWGPLMWTLVKGLAGGPGNYFRFQLQQRRWFLCCLAVGPIALFTLAALWGAQGLFHWQAPGYLLVFPLLGKAIADGMTKGRTIVRWWLNGSIAVFLIIVLILGSHAATGWMRDAVPHWFVDGDPATESLDWRDLPVYLAEQGLLEKNNQFIVAVNWIDAGKIDYILGGQLPLLCLNNAPHHFVFLHKQTAFKGQDALLIGRSRIMKNAITMYQPQFEFIEPYGSLSITRAGRNEFTVDIYYGRNFQANFPLPYE
ncbi:MAG: glycosyltransferase family 39 protein [Negativicutes bacterium]